MQNATDDRSSEPSTLQGGVAPQLLILTADSLRAKVALFAPTEGRARFIAGSTARTDEPQRGIPGAFNRLAAKCGYVVSEDMTRVSVIAGPPIALQIVGERTMADAATLEQAERFGVVRIAEEPLTPPRHVTRKPSWYQPMTDAWRSGRIEALLIIVPAGILPLWAAQLLNALSDIPSPRMGRCLVIASDPDLAAALPPDTVFILRDDQTAARLTDALNQLRAASLLHQDPGATPILARSQALAAAARAIVSGCGRPCVYLDVADGTTIVVADNNGAQVNYDPEIDAARGATRLLHRRAPEHITRWVPFALDDSDARTWALRRIANPSAPLADVEDSMIAAAFVRAALRPMLDAVAPRIPDEAIWILGSSIARLGSHEAALHVVADLMPSLRVAIVSCDHDDLLPAIGALAESYPADASSLLAHDALVLSGSVVQAALSAGRARRGTGVTLTSGGQTKTIELAADQLTTIGCEGPAMIRLTGEAANGEAITVQGGPGGILMDTRRRPLTTPMARAPRPNVSGRLRPASTTNGVVNR